MAALRLAMAPVAASARVLSALNFIENRRSAMPPLAPLPRSPQKTGTPL